MMSSLISAIRRQKQSITRQNLPQRLLAVGLLYLLVLSPSLCAAASPETSRNTSPAKKVAAQDLKLIHVTGPVYAIVGPLGDRTAENLGNNATFGFVLTTQGTVVIDPGGTYKGAEKIHQLIKQVSPSPIRYVINTGGQDHRFLGNDYFKKQGAKVIASNDAVKDQKARLNEILIRLGNTAGDKAMKNTHESYADIRFADKYQFNLGDIDFEITHPSGAHSPGDSFVWIKKYKTVFTGDIVYTQRMLSMMSFSNSRNWIQAYEAVASLRAQHVVPGHGAPTDMKIADRDTYSYLTSLRQKVGEFMAAGGDIADVNKIDQSKYQYLANYSALKGRNVQKIFQEMEFE
jgi:glyoxylase-like metal-dependent hydrolase (beta-lactamase superfamily II)